MGHFDSSTKYCKDFSEEREREKDVHKKKLIERKKENIQKKKNVFI